MPQPQQPSPRMAPLYPPTFLLLLLLHRTAAASATGLRPGYFATTCPQAESTVREVVRKAIDREPRNAASVMRLQFHDCFVNGCDGSVLLDDTPTMPGEKQALSNINSLRAFNVIDEAKEAVEKICPETVSCADIVVMAARDAVALTGGPDWVVKLGRNDSLTVSKDDSDRIMPSPRSNATYLISLFNSFNLSVKDLVALSGSHSIGKARCFSIIHRLYNQSGPGKPDPAIEPGFRDHLFKLCPQNGDTNVTVDLDSTAKVFDNQYFKDLVAGRGFLYSDQTLHSFEETREWVVRFSADQGEFFRAFVDGMVKMGDLESGRSGEIRKNCRVVNGREKSKLVLDY